MHSHWGMVVSDSKVLPYSGLLRRVYWRPCKIWFGKNMAKSLKTHHIFPVAFLPVSNLSASKFQNFVSDVNFPIWDKQVWKFLYQLNVENKLNYLPRWPMPSSAKIWPGHQILWPPHSESYPRSFFQHSSELLLGGVKPLIGGWSGIDNRTSFAGLWNSRVSTLLMTFKF